MDAEDEQQTDLSHEGSGRNSSYGFCRQFDEAPVHVVEAEHELGADHRAVVEVYEWALTDSLIVFAEPGDVHPAPTTVS